MMHAIFSRRLVVASSSSSQLIKSLMKQPPLSHRIQSRHFMSLSSSSSSSATPFVPSRFQNLGFFFPNMLRNTKLGNLFESRAGIFDSSFASNGFESETKGFTGFQKRRWKAWFNGTSAVVFGLIITNAAVYAMMMNFHPQWLITKFVLTPHNILNGGVHTMITQGISHFSLGQMLLNMFGICYFGTRIGRTLGPRYLLKLYFAGTLGGSVFFLSYHALVAYLEDQGVVIKKQLKPKISLVGADGAVFAITLLDLFLYPNVTTYAAFLLRVPVLTTIVKLGHDMLMMLEGQQNSLSTCSNHMGGAIVAAIAWKCLRRG